MTLDDAPDATDAPDYIFKAEVLNIVDGDTFDAKVDLGFEVSHTFRVRTRDIDTRETHFVSHDSEEYQRGAIHTRAFVNWVEEARNETDSEWPFLLYSKEYRRGAYGRVVGDIYSTYHGEWASRYLFNEFDDVSLYE